MRIIITMMLFLTTILAVSGQENSSLLNKLVEKEILTTQEAEQIALEEQEQQMKSDKKWEAKIDKALSSFSSRYLNLSGYANVRYSYSNTEDVKHAVDIPFASLSIRGEPINNVSYFVLLGLKRGELTEYNFSWRIINGVNVKVGQQKIPIVIENQMSPVKVEFIQFSKTMEYLVGGGFDVLRNQNGKHNSGRDIGFQIFGEAFKLNERPFLEYAVGIFQGSGINSSAYRSDKDFTMNLLLSPFKGFRVGGGAYFGQAKYEDVQRNIDLGKHVRNRWVASSDYQSELLTARVEYVYGNDAGIQKDGVNGIVTWAFVPQKWYLLGKVEYYNDNRRIDREFIDFAGGVTFKFAKGCRLQYNHTYTKYSKIWGEKNSHLSEFQVQISF